MNLHEFSEWYADNYLEETLLFAGIIYFLSFCLWLFTKKRAGIETASIYDFSNQTSEEYQ